MRPAEKAVALQGHWAGSVSRFLAFVIDYFVIGVLYSAGLLLASLAAEVVLGSSISLDEHRVLSLLAFALWVVPTAEPSALSSTAAAARYGEFRFEQVGVTHLKVEENVFTSIKTLKNCGRSRGLVPGKRKSGFPGWNFPNILRGGPVDFNFSGFNIFQAVCFF